MAVREDWKCTSCNYKGEKIISGGIGLDHEDLANNNAIGHAQRSDNICPECGKNTYFFDMTFSREHLTIRKVDSEPEKKDNTMMEYANMMREVNVGMTKRHNLWLLVGKKIEKCCHDNKCENCIGFRGYNYPRIKNHELIYFECKIFNKPLGEARQESIPLPECKEYFGDIG